MRSPRVHRPGHVLLCVTLLAGAGGIAVRGAVAPPAANTNAAAPAPITKTVVVFCGSSDDVDSRFLTAAAHLGEEMADRGWTLLYGGGTTGLMGAVSRGAKAHGGKVIGVVSEAVEKKGRVFAGADQMVRV